MVGESLFLEVPWRIILASFIAIILSETADTEIYQKLLQRSWFQRVLGSNLVSIPLDSLLFNIIALCRGVRTRDDGGRHFRRDCGEVYPPVRWPALWRSQNRPLDAPAAG